MTTALPRPFATTLQPTSGLEIAVAAAARSHDLLAAPRQHGSVYDARRSSPSRLFAKLENSAGDAADSDTSGGSQRRRLAASPLSLDGDNDAGVRAGHLQPWEEAFVVRERGEVFNLKGQCSDGDSFTVSSQAMPDMDGCYSSVPGTSFGEGFLYSTDDDGDRRTIFPKIITISGESNYFWAASPLPLFSEDDVVIDCLSVETTSAAIHPASATWQCDVDATGQLVLVEDSEFFLVCGCGTSATSGSSGSGSSSSGNNEATPAPGQSERFTATPTTAPTTAAPGSTVAPASTTAAPTNVPTTAPTPAITIGPPDDEREVSGGRPRITRDSFLTVMTTTVAFAAAVVSLTAGACAANYAVVDMVIL